MQELFRIRRIATAPYQPNSVGMVERLNKTLMEALRTHVEDSPHNWDDFLSTVLYAYRTSIHASTNETPAYLCYARDLLWPEEACRLPAELLYKDPRDYVADLTLNLASARRRAIRQMLQAQARYKAGADKDLNARVFSPGDKVWLRMADTEKPPRGVSKKFRATLKGPFRIMAESYPNYIIKHMYLPHSRSIVAHVGRLHPCNSPGIADPFEEAPEYPAEVQEFGEDELEAGEFEEEASNRRNPPRPRPLLPARPTVPPRHSPRLLRGACRLLPRRPLPSLSQRWS